MWKFQIKIRIFRSLLKDLSWINLHICVTHGIGWISWSSFWPMWQWPHQTLEMSRVWGHSVYCVLLNHYQLCLVSKLGRFFWKTCYYSSYILKYIFFILLFKVWRLLWMHSSFQWSLCQKFYLLWFFYWWLLPWLVYRVIWAFCGKNASRSRPTTFPMRSGTNGCRTKNTLWKAKQTPSFAEIRLVQGEF